MAGEDSELEQDKKAVLQQIRNTFETIAKTAHRGAAEADDPSLNILEAVSKAYQRVTLIVDDAMRGLRELNDRVVRLAILGNLIQDEAERPRRSIVICPNCAGLGRLENQPEFPICQVCNGAGRLR